MSRDFIDGLVARAQTPLKPQTVDKRSGQTDGPGFADVLKQAELNQSGLRISSHAMARMQQRGVRLTSTDLSQLGKAVDTAASKGARDAYLLYGQTGFVVNVPNRTVVTAMANEDNTVVTNIDSVVIVPRLDRSGGLAVGTD